MKQRGFTAIELLITLFIAAAFLMSGYQLYSLIIKDSYETRAQARANNVAYDYLQRYKPDDNSPCPASTRIPKNNEPITVSGLKNAAVTVTISCPYTSAVYVSKVSVDLTYGNGAEQKTISNATYVPAQEPCPSGFIVVPGSATYGTNSFCVMKYEAKQVGATTTPISQASGLPWVNVPQETAGANNDAKEYSANVAGCPGCHLITEAEWLTIAQNVLSVNTNWSNNTIGGANYIYSGHNNDIPTGAQVAGPSDANGYAGTNSAPNQRRTLTLTNGEVIWDLAGNVYEWTSGTVQSPTIQPGITGAGYTWREWTAVTNPGTISPNPNPDTTGITGAISWNSSNGIGQIYSNADETGLRGFLRGGIWDHGNTAGVLTLVLDFGAGGAGPGIGFRVAR